MFASRLALFLLILFSNNIIATEHKKNCFLWVTLDNTDQPKTIECFMTTDNFKEIGRIFPINISNPQAEQAVINTLHFYENTAWVLAGECPETTRSALKKYLPSIAGYLHYHNYDITVLENTFEWLKTQKPLLSSFKKALIYKEKLCASNARPKNHAHQKKMHIYVWIDLEMTSTNSNNGAITEIACTITDTHFQKIGSEFYCAIHHPEATLQNASEWVKKNQSQTLQASHTSRTSIAEAKKQLCAFIEQYKNNILFYAGNCITTDLEFIKRDIPELFQRFFTIEKTFDVVTLRYCMRWFPNFILNQKLIKQRKSYSHDPRKDLEEAINEARYYKSQLEL